MLKWISRRLDLAAARSARGEIEYFIEKVDGANPEELGVIVAMATHYRNGLAKRDIDLLRPAEVAKTYPLIVHKIGKLVVSAGRRDPLHGFGWVVWLHTMRAANMPEIHPHGRQLWLGLAQGFPHVESQAGDLSLVLNHQLDIVGYDSVPQGFGPNDESPQ
jgi:hypothetical protein